MSTPKVPSKADVARRKAENEAEVSASGDTATTAGTDVDGGGGASTANAPPSRRSSSAVKPDLRINLFHDPGKSVTQYASKGILRQAIKTFPVEGMAQKMAVMSTFWNGNKGMVFNCMNTCVGHHGAEQPFAKRNLGKGKSQEVPSFLGQKMHENRYGAIDRIGKGAGGMGANFNVRPWHRHPVQGVENIAAHAMWMITRYLANRDLATIAEEKSIDISKARLPANHIFQPFTVKGMGATEKLKFMAMVTEDVLCRATERIIAKVGREKHGELTRDDVYAPGTAAYNASDGTNLPKIWDVRPKRKRDATVDDFRGLMSPKAKSPRTGLSPSGSAPAPAGRGRGQPRKCRIDKKVREE